MPSDKNPSLILTLIVAPVLVALLARETAPWWWGPFDQWRGTRVERSPSVLDLVPNALPLQEGTYYLGSNYISIHRKGERFCLWDGYIQNHTIASILEDPNTPNVYQVRGYGSTVLLQKDYSSIVFKDRPYETLEESNDLGIDDNDMKSCLDSSAPFYEKRGIEKY